MVKMNEETITPLKDGGEIIQIAFGTDVKVGDYIIRPIEVQNGIVNFWVYPDTKNTMALPVPPLPPPPPPMRLVKEGSNKPITTG